VGCFREVATRAEGRREGEAKGRNGQINIPHVTCNTFIFTAMRCVISHHKMGDITQIVTGNWE
jgi:hypothetical protein